MEFKGKLVGVSDDVAAKLFTGLKDGKYEVKKESGQIENNSTSAAEKANS